MSREIITLEQLAEHNDVKSLWIAVHGQVYDLTTFGSDHPGGIEALENCAGLDGTEAYEYAGHNESNMARMQQFSVGRLAGSPEQRIPPMIASEVLFTAKSTHAGTTASRSRQSILPPWTRLAVTIVSVTSLLVALSFQRSDSIIDHISAQNVSQLQFTPIWDLKRPASEYGIRRAFCAGIAIASSVSCMGLVYFYRLFLSTLDYQNEVFSYPATIPRKTRRQ